VIAVQDTAIVTTLISTFLVGLRWLCLNLSLCCACDKQCVHLTPVLSPRWLSDARRRALARTFGDRRRWPPVVHRLFVCFTPGVGHCSYTTLSSCVGQKIIAIHLRRSPNLFYIIIVCVGVIRGHRPSHANCTCSHFSYASFPRRGVITRLARGRRPVHCSAVSIPVFEDIAEIVVGSRRRPAVIGGIINLLLYHYYLH
jgi:hypothetical protein